MPESQICNYEINDIFPSEDLPAGNLYHTSIENFAVRKSKASVAR